MLTNKALAGCAVLAGCVALAGCGSGGAGPEPGPSTGTGGTDPGTGLPDGGMPGGGSGGGTTTPDGHVSLRLLTKSEYQKSVTQLLGPVSEELRLAEDLSKAGFYSIGATQVSVTEVGVEKYEDASLKLVDEVFGDPQRRQALVGCEPQPAANDTCAAGFITAFGRRAFRRPLTEAEVLKWVGVAQAAGTLAADPMQGLRAATSGLLQSPYFLYRKEVAVPDPASGKARFDGYSMASRMSFLLTGATPTDALLDLAATGQLDTEEGVRNAATGLLGDPRTSDHLADFFVQLAGIESIGQKTKDPVAFPEFGPALAASMLEETRLWLRDIVLAPGADVRAFFDSTQTMVDAPMANLYGLPAPAAGFAPAQLSPDSGRAGIFGKASFLTAHSTPDSSSPTGRGHFVMDAFLCLPVPDPPPGIDTEIDPLKPGEKLTTRQRFERHRNDPSCASCHEAMDPYGLALEHFDPIGRYRADEFGVPIDATGSVNGVNFDGGAELGAVLREDKSALACMISNFYRYSNASVDRPQDQMLLEALGKSFAAGGYVWRNWIVEYMASDAFRAAAQK